MIGDIRKHIEKTPFVSFTIKMGDGQSYHIATRDHIIVAGSRALVLLDNDDYDILPGLLMCGLSISSGARDLETQAA